MAMPLPMFDKTEYGMLLPDLSGPMAYHEFLEISQRKREAERESHTLLGLPPTGQRLLELIQEEILTTVTEQPKEEQRKNLLRNLSEECRELQTEKSINENLRKARLADVVQKIVKMYFTVDLQQFQVDYSAIFMDELANDSFPRRVVKLKKIITDSEARAAKTVWMTGGLTRFFREGRVPAHWRSFRVNPLFTADEMARRIIESFVTDWRSRASRFELPVTITGVNIATMPEKIGSIWKKCYDLFQLGNEPKTVMYRSLEADYQRSSASEVPLDDDIPDSFRKS